MTLSAEMTNYISDTRRYIRQMRGVIDTVMARYNVQTEQVKMLQREVLKFREHCQTYHDHLTCRTVGGRDHFHDFHNEVRTDVVYVNSYRQEQGQCQTAYGEQLNTRLFVTERGLTLKECENRCTGLGQDCVAF
jgi:hypothetical protein